MIYTDGEMVTLVISRRQAEAISGTAGIDSRISEAITDQLNGVGIVKIHDAKRSQAEALALELFMEGGAPDRPSCCHHLNDCHGPFGCVAGWALDDDGTVLAGCTCLSRGSVRQAEED